MASIPERWAEQARYDLDTARAMLDSGRYLYVLFCCRQVLSQKKGSELFFFVAVLKAFTQLPEKQF